jgi:hypothetical protein
MNTRTYIKHTESHERGWRIISLIAFFLGLVLTGWSLAQTDNYVVASVTMLVGLIILFMGILCFSWNELIVHGCRFPGEPQGSDEIRRFIEIAEEEGINGITIRQLLLDTQRFVDSYALDLPLDLEERIRLIKKRLER